MHERSPLPERLRAWEEAIARIHEGQIVSGTVTRKIKGGFLVELHNVPVFLPESHVGADESGDPTALVGRELRFKILKIDTTRMNIVVSRKRLLEDEGLAGQ